jgi:HEAT repeat protein
MKKIKEIIQILSADEPDYSSIASKLVEEDYEAINKLTKNRSTTIAARAIICLGYRGAEKSMDAIVSAAKNNNPVLRLAAAQALSKMKGVSSSPYAVKLLDDLLDDKDIGVKKFALKATGNVSIPTLKKKIKKVSESDQNNNIKKLAQSVLEQLK